MRGRAAPVTVVVVTDTSCRLPADLREQWSIRQVPLHILLDGLDLRDGVDEIPDDIHKRHATTAGATPVELSAAYQRALADSGGDGVVAVHISSALSGTFRAAELTAAELGPAVRVIDSRSAAMGVGFAALAAGRAAAAGDELDTVARAAAAAVSRIHAFVAVARLDNLRRSGRISGAKAWLGTALALKPLLSVDDGKLVLVQRVRTVSNATAVMIDRVCQLVGDRPAALAVHHVVVIFTCTWPRHMPQSDSVTVTLCSPTEDDWPGMFLLAAASFTDFIGPESATAWRTLVPTDGAVVVRDGAGPGSEVVGMALYMDLRLTVPGEVVLPTAGLSFVAVAPTHRRRGLLRAMCAELHRRIADSGYPVAALHASEGGIYGRFGYGPATTLHELTVDRRFARFHADAPGGGLGGSSVRLVRPTEHRGEFEAIYERWRQQVPGGLLRPQVLWDELLAECKAAPGGDRESFALLHPDGYALYRVDRTDLKLARVSELRAVTADAHCALWRALIGLDSMERISIITHPQDPLPHLLTDTRLARTTWRQDGLWLRIMNVPAALEARGYAHEVGEFSTVLEVSDGGRFALKIGDGRARCTPTDAAAEIEMDRDVLGSLYLGAHRASTLAAANRLRTKDSQLLRRLDAAFASDVPVQTAFEF